MFRYRECDRGDCSIWLELNKAFMMEEIRGNELWKDVNRVSDQEFRETFLTGLTERDHVRFLMFEEDEEPVGFANLMIVYSVWTHGRALIIDDLYFRPGERGSGKGKRAMEMIEEYAKTLGCKRVQLQAELSNPGAMEFYKAIGYQSADMKFYVKYL